MDLSVRYVELLHFISMKDTVSDAVLHIHCGMIVFLATHIVTGRSLATVWPLLAVVLAALVKEFADYLAYGHIKADTLCDIFNTVMWPTLLCFGLRIRCAKNLGADISESEAGR